MSSSKPTDRGRSPGRETADTGAARAGSTAAAWPVLLVPLLAGWLYILRANHWYFAASTLILFVGWLAVLLAAGFLLEAGLAAASGSTRAGDEDLWRPEGRREELLREKRALLKAIKEIEFDHQMGKMSEEDAASIGRFYRARAIQIIKALEGKEAPRAAPSASDGEQRSVEEQIEADVAARLEEDKPS